MAKNKAHIKKWNFPKMWLILLLIILLFLVLLIYAQQAGKRELLVDVNPACNSEYPFKCDGECFSCEAGTGYKLCCKTAEDNWCCPIDEECDYDNSDCISPVAHTYPKESEDNKANIINQIKKTIVWVKYTVAGKNNDGSYFQRYGTGSGVIVGSHDNELIIYTNRHVVDCEYNDMDCFQRISEDIQVRTQDGKMHDVIRTSFSKSDVDLAVLTVKTTNASDYDSAYYADAFDIGDEVIAVGYPAYAKNVVEFSVSKGSISKMSEVLSQSTGDNFRVLESDAFTYFGSSGGGLFDRYGNLIGINTWLSGTQDSIAIDFSSVQAHDYVYCDTHAYYADGSCYEYCGRDQVMGYENRACYDVCDSFYCNSKRPDANDARCQDKGYILGSDGLCHLPCGSPNTYCSTANSLCFNNQCYVQCSQGYLWEDGTCRYIQ